MKIAHDSVFWVYLMVILGLFTLLLYISQAGISKFKYAVRDLSTLDSISVYPSDDVGLTDYHHADTDGVLYLHSPHTQ